MKKIPKAGLLIITLVIPALIFMFLSFFGRNHYDLPHFKPMLNADSSVVLQQGDTLFQSFPQICGSAMNTAEQLTVVYPLTKIQSADSLDAVQSQWQRIEGLKGEIKNIQLVALTVGSDSLPQLVDKNWNIIKQSPEQKENCLTVLADSGAVLSKVILIDTKGQIRGYYKLADSEETDRLMAEIKILKYENEK